MVPNHPLRLLKFLVGFVVVFPLKPLKVRQFVAGDQLQATDRGPPRGNLSSRCLPYKCHVSWRKGDNLSIILWPVHRGSTSSSRCATPLMRWRARCWRTTAPRCPLGFLWGSIGDIDQLVSKEPLLTSQKHNFSTFWVTWAICL